AACSPVVESEGGHVLNFCAPPIETTNDHTSVHSSRPYSRSGNRLTQVNTRWSTTLEPQQARCSPAPRFGCCKVDPRIRRSSALQHSVYIWRVYRHRRLKQQ
ncbi:unnamed protein product, partial [Ectocarpus fasciculatus]